MPIGTAGHRACSSNTHGVRRRRGASTPEIPIVSVLDEAKTTCAGPADAASGPAPRVNQPELGQARQGEVGLGVVDELAYARLTPAGGEEALLEVEERVLPAARPAAEVELLEPLLLPPARRLEEDEVRRRRFAAALARSGDVVMQPGSGREAERGGRELVAEASLDEHDLLTQPLGERLP